MMRRRHRLVTAALLASAGYVLLRLFGFTLGCSLDILRRVLER